MGRAQFIHQLAEQLVQAVESRDPWIIAEHLGIYVSDADLGTLKGFYWQTLGERHIVLNQDLSNALSRVICAHELGHDQLHQALLSDLPHLDHDLFNPSHRLEYEANLFAAELLISDDALFSKLSDCETLPMLAADLRIPVPLVALKLRQLNSRGHPVPRLEEVNANFLAPLEDDPSYSDA